MNDTSDARSSPARLWLGTLVFVVFVPGSVLVYVPYALTGWEVGPPLLGLAFLRWLGGLAILVGLPVFADFLWRFVREGRGTPAPVAPPTELVATGGFRHVRNPGYVAVLALIAGQALLFGSRALLLYAALVWLAFHLFVVLREEPSLRRRFGASYAEYCREVPRWIPRLRGARRP